MLSNRNDVGKQKFTARFLHSWHRYIFKEYSTKSLAQVSEDARTLGRPGLPGLVGPRGKAGYSGSRGYDGPTGPKGMGGGNAIGMSKNHLNRLLLHLFIIFNGVH